MAGFKLSEVLQGKYKVVNTHLPMLHHPKLGLVDFRSITVEQAEALIEAGTDYLVKIKKRAVS